MQALIDYAAGLVTRPWSSLSVPEMLLVAVLSLSALALVLVVVNWIGGNRR